MRDQNQTTDVCDNFTCDFKPTSIGTLCYLVKEIRIYWKTNPAQLESLVERIPNTRGKRCPGDEPACQVSRRRRHFVPGWRSMMGQCWRWYKPSMSFAQTSKTHKEVVTESSNNKIYN